MGRKNIRRHVRYSKLLPSFNAEFLLVLLVALLACGHLSACAGTMAGAKAEGPGINTRAAGKTALDGIFGSYRIFDRNSFMGRVAQNFIPDRNAFINRVAQNFAKDVLIEFNYFVDTAIRQEGYLSIGFHWEKKTQPYGSSALVLIKGKTEFVFSYEGEKWLLYQMRGDDPF